MRRRIVEEPATPPVELTDYRRWCASRVAEPFGHELACAQFDAWREQRRAWAVRHGISERELGPLGDAPWDPGAV
jgi:hypothetical protein